MSHTVRVIPTTILYRSLSVPVTRDTPRQSPECHDKPLAQLGVLFAGAAWEGPLGKWATTEEIVDEHSRRASMAPPASRTLVSRDLARCHSDKSRLNKIS